MPFAGQAAREAEAAGTGLRRDHPGDVAARPGAAACEERDRLGERPGHVGGEHRVGASVRQIGLPPACRHEGRRRRERPQAGLHDRRRLDRDPGRAGIAQGRAELPAAGADIEEVADPRQGRPQQRGEAGDVIGAVDAGGVEGERIDPALGVGGAKRPAGGP